MYENTEAMTPPQIMLYLSMRGKNKMKEVVTMKRQEKARLLGEAHKGVIQRTLNWNRG